MLEMPNLFERNMTLGEQAYEEEQYELAREHFESAYNIKNEIEANASLCKSLIALKEYEQAYQIINEKKQNYREQGIYQGYYFEVLLQLNLFFEIEKLLVSETLENRQDFEKAYSIAKEYHLMIYKEKYKKIEESIMELPHMPTFQQNKVLKQLSYLPKERVIPLAQKLLVNPNVSLFSRSELIQQLAQINLVDEIKVLTYNNEILSFTPCDIGQLKEVYEESKILKEVGEYFEQNNPSLKLEVEKTIRLHLGCLYPFHNIVMTPVNDWVESYKEKYENTINNEARSNIYEIQEMIDQEVLKLFSFQE